MLQPFCGSGLSCTLACYMFLEFAVYFGSLWGMFHLYSVLLWELICTLLHIPREYNLVDFRCVCVIIQSFFVFVCLVNILGSLLADAQ